MLEDIRQTYIRYADHVVGWKTMNKNDLINLYLEHENTEPERSYYFSALMCRYWSNVYKFYRTSKSTRLELSDFTSWLAEAFFVAFKYRRWKDPSSRLYTDPQAPDKVVNRCIYSTRMRYYQYYNMNKRRLNFQTDSIERQLETFGNMADVNKYLIAEDVIKEDEKWKQLINHYLSIDNIFIAIILDLICFDDVFREIRTVQTVEAKETEIDGLDYEDYEEDTDEEDWETTKMASGILYEKDGARYMYNDDDIPQLDKSTFKSNFERALATNNYEKAKAIYDIQVLDRGANAPETMGTKLALDEMSKNFDQGENHRIWNEEVSEKDYEEDIKIDTEIDYDSEDDVILSDKKTTNIKLPTKVVYQLEFSKRKLLSALRKLDDSYIVYFLNRYEVDEVVLVSTINQIKELNLRKKLLRTVNKLLVQVSKDKRMREVLC